MLIYKIILTITRLHHNHDITAPENIKAKEKHLITSISNNDMPIINLEVIILKTTQLFHHYFLMIPLFTATGAFHFS